MFSGDVSPYGSSEKSSDFPGSSKIFSILQLSIIAAYLQLRIPNPKLLFETFIPMAVVNSQLPSGIIFIFLIPKSEAHAFITNASLTETTYISSIPFSLNS